MRIRKSLKILLLLIIVALLTIVAYTFGRNYVINQDARSLELKKAFTKADDTIIKKDSPGAIEIVIPSASSTKDIAAILGKNSLIKNEFLFTILSKFNGYDGNYIKGTHYLVKGMSYDEIMLVLTHPPKPILITFREGMSYQQMKQLMKDKGMTINDELMDNMVRRPNMFIDYDFVRSIKFSAEREWALQGYLWPDTYEFDPNADEESILRVFLDNTEIKLKNSTYVQRAKEQGWTLDEVITLASIVQEEGAEDEMAKIARVFLNRIDKKMPLQSCATINYLKSEQHEEKVLWLTSTDLTTYAENKFNTYEIQGLPPGPIGSPGTIAIEAVLWPATNRTWRNAGSYLYFCADGDGGNDFSIDYDDHMAKIKKYSAKQP